jgi:hypothetical protein
MIEKNYKKDLLNYKEVLELLKLVEEVKYKSDKLKTELLMLYVPLKLPFHKVLYQEEEQLFYMLQKNLMIYWLNLKI